MDDVFCHSRGNGNPVFWVIMDSASSAEWQARKHIWKEYIWKNKANFRKGKVVVSVYIKGYYEKFCGFERQKTKPIQTQLQTPDRTQSGFPPSREWQIWNPARRKILILFEKTKPIWGRAKLAQSLIWKVIMKNFMLWDGEKTKPILGKAKVKRQKE